MINDTYGRGKAVVTSQLNIESADENFNSFLGENVVYKLSRSVHPEDIERLESAMNMVYSCVENCEWRRHIPLGGYVYKLQRY